MDEKQKLTGPKAWSHQFLVFVHSRLELFLQYHKPYHLSEGLKFTPTELRTSSPIKSEVDERLLKSRQNSHESLCQVGFSKVERVN